MHICMEILPCTKHKVIVPGEVDLCVHFFGNFYLPKSGGMTADCLVLQLNHLLMVNF